MTDNTEVCRCYYHNAWKFQTLGVRVKMLQPGFVPADPPPALPSAIAIARLEFEAVVTVSGSNQQSVAEPVVCVRACVCYTL